MKLTAKMFYDFSAQTVFFKQVLGLILKWLKQLNMVTNGKRKLQSLQQKQGYLLSMIKRG